MLSVFLGIVGTLFIMFGIVEYVVMDNSQSAIYMTLLGLVNIVLGAINK